MKSVVLWSVLSSGYWFVEDFKTIISLSSQVMLRMPMSSFEADTQCNKEKQYIFFQLSNQHEWAKPLWTCLRNVGKKPVKIKQEFPNDGKYIWACLGTILCSMPRAQQRGFFLWVSCSTWWKQSCALLWLNCKQTLSQGVCVWETLPCAERFSLLSSSNV